jgi:rhamnosyltransferase subunit B
MAKFIFLTSGTGGDLYPFIQVCRALIARGREVTLITNQKHEEIVTRHNITFAPLLVNEQVAQSNSLTPQGIHLEGGQNRRKSILTTFQMFLNVYGRLHEHQHGSNNTILVGHENVNTVSQTIAEMLGLPYAEVFTAPYFLMRMQVKKGELETESQVIHQLRAKFGLPPVHNWEDWLQLPKWKIGLWPEWFAPRDPEWLFEVSPVGFIWDPDYEVGVIPQEASRFLTDDEPPILITHGTSRPDDAEFFSAGIEACRSLGEKCLVVTPHDDLAITYNDHNMRRYNYLPFASLFPYVKAIIHHGGIGTLNRAIAAGIPQLALAYGFDRPDNGARIQRLGVGEYLPPISWRPNIVAEALRRILAADVRERCKQVALKFADIQDPTAALCGIIDSPSLFASQ